MDIFFAAIGLSTLLYCGLISWHVLTDDDECQHGNIGQHGGECQDCGERIEIGGSE